MGWLLAGILLSPSDITSHMELVYEYNSGSLQTLQQLSGLSQAANTYRELKERSKGNRNSRENSANCLPLLVISTIDKLTN